MKIRNFRVVWLFLYFFSSAVFAETITIVTLSPTGVATQDVLTKEVGESINVVVKPKVGFKGVVKINDQIVAMGEINKVLRYRHVVTNDLTINISYLSSGFINRAILGPLASSTVNVLKLSDLGNPIATTTTNGKGFFFFNNIQHLNDKDYYLVSVAKGVDTDANDDGNIDDFPTLNNGTIYGLVSGNNIKKGAINVTAISDIAWRYIEKNIREMSNNDIQRRLTDIAVTLFLLDITGDGVINDTDLISFNPQDENHKNSLKFNYQTLFEEDAENDSIISTYHDNKLEKLKLLLDSKFGNRLSFYTAKDSRTRDVKIEVIPFGKGDFFSEDGKINYDANRETSDNKVFSFYTKNDAFITITATPKVDTKILSWGGCDIVSIDKSECQVSLSSDHQISVSFGYKETQIIKNIVDLSRANVSLEGDSKVYVTINHGDDELVTKMSDLVIDDYVVGSTNNGFLRKVSLITKISDFKYNLESVDATLDEVIKQGTGTFSKVMTNEDIDSNVLLTSQQQARISRSTNSNKLEDLTPRTPIDKTINFSKIDGVKLMRSNNSKESTFTIKIGNSSVTEKERLQRRTLSVGSIGIKKKEPVVLYSKDGIDVKANGEVKIDLKLDIGVSYGFFSGLEYFKIIPQIKATEKLEFFIGGDVNLDKKIKLGSIPFQKMVFFIGPIPVYIQSTLDVFIGFDGKVTAKVNTGIELKQKIRFGVVYNKGAGTNIIGEFKPSWDFLEPKAEVSYEMQGSIEPRISVLIYGVLGPAVRFSAYLKMKTDLVNFDTNLDTWRNDPCLGGDDNTAVLGIKSNFEWAGIGGDSSKFGKFIFEKLNVVTETEFFNKEWLLARWQVGGICDDSKTPPKLKLEGDHITEIVTTFSEDNITKTFLLSNTGGTDLDWEIQYIEDNVISVSKTSGTISPNADDIVTVTLDPSILDVGTYHNKLKFINSYDFGLISDDDGGTTEREIDIELVPENIASPTNFNAELLGATIVELTWNYPDSEQFIDLVKGYRIYQSTDQTNWESIVVLNDVDIVSYKIPNLLTDTTYYFQIDAYTDDVSSETVNTSIYIPKIEPEGDCRVHFTGLVLADQFSDIGISEIYILDHASEYVGAGLYPDNNQAFPKAVEHTFDGIAIDTGTKVTIYSQKDFGGTILYEKIGPAIINNGIWEDDSRYAPKVNATWKEPLQTNYPSPVREWSRSDMHDWSSGSLMVECGF